ncbi:peptidase S8/S53 domain-containing protein [Achaetomium macrosporum]|uniref:Peptidase S8/S53 domain-containing protein n=1 Tax=Achaetomium macrosporum TaxID=79813 RepID=A0AAN7C7V0_9PEZI|nr:peptidase S8/S53 domain-containing protein [Achaetomium macrosporum]
MLASLASAYSICAAAALAVAAHAHPSLSTKLTHEKRDIIPGQWTKVSRAEATVPVTLRIGLKQRNLERADEFISAIAHPGSETYGQHWTPQKVIDTFAPSDEAIAETEQWLLAEGVASDRISRTSGRNWIKVTTTVGEAESLLDTTYNVYENNDGTQLVACESYSVPAAIQGHIDLVAPTIQFDEREAIVITRRLKQRDDSTAPKFKKLPPHPDFDADSLKNCSEVTTPACLRALYNIPKKVHPVQGNSYGIVEFAPQSYNQDDLNVFFSVYGSHSIPNGTAPIFQGIDGGYLSSESGSGIRGESNLDLSYAIALTYPQNVTLYQVGDSVAWNPATNNNFLDAIDGSYCTTDGGDSPDWDAIYPHDASSGNADGVYTGQPMCGVYNATKVISVSYGSNEDARPASYRARECAEYMKLGLMGVTVLFSSGDDGVAGLRGQCVKPDGSYTPVGAEYGRFNPMFPGTCPWITSVGGTALPPNSSTIHQQTREIASYKFFSGGGFSNLFPLPSYQASAVSQYYAHHDPGYNSSTYNNTRAVRGYPDVALAAQDYVTGIDGGFMAFSGTSASSPTFGAMIALINGERMKAGKGPVGFINPVLYAHPEVFRDVVEGKNPGCGTDGFSAVEGWDPVTGLGAPDYEKLKKVFLALP